MAKGDPPNYRGRLDRAQSLPELSARSNFTGGGSSDGNSTVVAMPLIVQVHLVSFRLLLD